MESILDGGKSQLTTEKITKGVWNYIALVGRCVYLACVRTCISQMKTAFVWLAKLCISIN